MMVEIEITKDYGRLKKGEVHKVGESTAKILIELKKIAKMKGAKESKPKKTRTTKK